MSNSRFNIVGAKQNPSKIEVMSEAAPSSNRQKNRQGKKVIQGFFSPEMSAAMHIAARKRGITLTQAMAEAFDNWLRDNGETPIGG